MEITWSVFTLIELLVIAIIAILVPDWRHRARAAASGDGYAWYEYTLQ